MRGARRLIDVLDLDARVWPLSICVLANACSLELPSSGELTTFDGNSTAQDAGARAVNEPEAQQPAREAEPEHSVEREPARDAGPVIADAANAEPPGCTLSGRYAARVVFEVSWVGTEFASIVPIISDGKGALSFDVLMELNAHGDVLDGRVRTCASEVPEFVATISGERYQAHFSEATWDAMTMPTFAITLRSACRTPGCSITGEPLYALIGAELAAPDAPWPMDASQGSWPDHDGDGLPGIAVAMRGRADGPYAYPPLDLVSYHRVQDLSLGLRVIMGLDGVLEGCDALRGTTREGSVETRAVACRANGSSACEARELAFLNQNLPVWSVRQGSFQAKRVASDADCRVARAAFARP